MQGRFSQPVFILTSIGLFCMTLLLTDSAGRKVQGFLLAASTSAQTATQSSVPLSSGVWDGDTLYISGKGSRDPATGQHPEKFEDQVRQALENCGASLKEAGLSFADVVNANVYLTDISAFQIMNKVYKTYFPQNPPARTTVALPALPGDSQVEITLIAVRNAQREYVFPEGKRASPSDLFSPGVLANETLYLSGQGSRDYNTRQLPAGEFEDHVKQTLENLGAVLKSAGMDYSNAVKADVYLTDMSLIGRMNAVYKTYFKTNPPVRATVAISALPGGPPIEISLVAVKGKRAVRRNIVPPGSASNMPFTPGVMVGDTLYLSGKAGFVKGGVEGQVKEAMDGLGEVLKAAGLDFSNVVEGKVYLAEIQDYARMNQVYGTYFGQQRPARTCVAISKLVADSRVEISLVASQIKRTGPR